MEKTGIILAVITLFALNMETGTQERLEACRQEIDSLDQRLVELIQERARVVEQVGVIKRQARLAVKDANREQQVIEKVQKLAKGGPLPAEAVGRIYQKLIEEMRDWEQKLNDAATPQSPGQPATTGGRVH
jgi:chorismate mutase / prephenate dehydratase